MRAPGAATEDDHGVMAVNLGWQGTVPPWTKSLEAGACLTQCPFKRALMRVSIPSTMATRIRSSLLKR